MNVEQILIEALTTAVAKLEAQPVKAYDPNFSRCFYIVPETGARCLYGHLMETPDPEAFEAICEAGPLHDLALSLGLTLDDLVPHRTALEYLQIIHDAYWEPHLSFKEAIAAAPAHYHRSLVRMLQEALQ